MTSPDPWKARLSYDAAQSAVACGSYRERKSNMQVEGLAQVLHACSGTSFLFHIKGITAFVHPSDPGLLPRPLAFKFFAVLSIISPLTRLVSTGVFTAVALGCPSQRHGCRSGSLVWLFSSTDSATHLAMPTSLEPKHGGAILAGNNKHWILQVLAG